MNKINAKREFSQLSSGTLATLTGKKTYSELDMELENILTFIDNTDISECENWKSIWNLKLKLESESVEKEEEQVKKSSSQEIIDIRNFLMNSLTDINTEIHIEAMNCKSKYLNECDPTKEEKTSYIALASSRIAVLTKAKRLFIDELKYEMNSLWDAYIQIFIFGSNISIDDKSKKLYKIDKSFKELVNKTKFPKRTEWGLFGMDRKDFELL